MNTELKTLLAENKLSAFHIARTIDHAILHPTATDFAIETELEAMHGLPLASVCIKPSHVRRAVEILRGGAVGAVCTVVGFPHGTATPQAKAFEAEQAMENGATEIDMVVNSGKALSGDWEYVREDIGETLATVRQRNGVLKVIFETDYLAGNDAVKIRLCETCSALGVDYVKTSTGFGFVKQDDGTMNYKGATEHDLVLMRAHCSTNVGIKASGGVRTLDDVLMAIRCGCTRIGASATLRILQQAQERLGGLDEYVNSEGTFGGKPAKGEGY